VLPPRDALITLLGSEIPPEQRTHLLAGRPFGATELTDAGRTVCTCFGVGLQTLHRTIVARRLTTVAEIGTVLRAGTNCGSCIPEISALLHETRLGSEAA
jgi:assimilatory nitrate reductase catalytic subunit